MEVGNGVKARVASLEDLARLKRTSPDLEGAVRLHALVGAPQVTREELMLPVDADPEPTAGSIASWGSSRTSTRS